jgi:hypothetical protein
VCGQAVDLGGRGVVVKVRVAAVVKDVELRVPSELIDSLAHDVEQHLHAKRTLPQGSEALPLRALAVFTHSVCSR